MGTTIAFSWQSVPESTWYLFWLGKGTPTAFVMEQWYTAEQAGCANGGTCTITITPPINAGSHVWFIRTWAGVDGPWSTGKQFILKDPAANWSSKLPDARRFTLVLDDEAVLDNETGLVWRRTPETTGTPWKKAHFNCAATWAARRFGWRLPVVSELLSLLDNTPTTPALPAGHPFLGVTTTPYWTQTLSTETPNFYYAVHFAIGGGFSSYENNATNLHLVWCVRAASVGGQ